MTVSAPSTPPPESKLDKPLISAVIVPFAFSPDPGERAPIPCAHLHKPGAQTKLDGTLLARDGKSFETGGLIVVAAACRC